MCSAAIHSAVLGRTITTRSPVFSGPSVSRVNERPPAGTVSSVTCTGASVAGSPVPPISINVRRAAPVATRSAGSLPPASTTPLERICSRPATRYRPPRRTTALPLLSASPAASTVTLGRAS